jgi:CHAT domain-containing protein/Flp pilus assembly protein TadD
MRYPNIGLSFLALVIATASTPITFSLSTSSGELRVVAQTPEARKAQADRLLEQGNQQYQKGEFKAALLSWEQALQIYRKIGDRALEGRALGNLGLAYGSLGDYQKAIDFYQQGLAIAKQIGDKAGIGIALGNLGSVYRLLGDYQKAIDFYQQSLAIAKQIGDKVGVGIALDNLGSVYRLLGDYQKAIDFYQSALAIFQQIGDRAREGDALGNLGTAYVSLGDYKTAIEFFQQGLAIAKQIGDKAGVGTALGNLGIAYTSLGDYKTAIDFHQQVLVIFKQIGDRNNEGTALGNLGLAYYSLGDYQKAIEFYQQHLVIAKQIGDKAGVGTALSGLGNAYYSLVDYQKAIDFHQQHLAIAKQIGDKAGVGDALGNLGLAYYSLGDYQKAIDFHQQRLAIAKQIGDKAGVGAALGNLGIAYTSLGDYQKAIEFYQQGLAIFQQIGAPADIGIALNNLGATLFKAGNLAEAQKALKQGIEVWKSQRSRLGNRDDFKISIFEQQAKTYRILQKVLIAQNQPDAALKVAESGRARAFVDLLVNRLHPNADASSSTDATSDKIKQIAKAQNTTVVEYSIITDDVKVQGKQEAKESELYIWVIKPNGEVTFRKVDLKPLWQKENTTLAQLVTNSRDSIGVRGRGIKVTHNPNPAKVKQRFQRLHELLINPIADLLPKNPDERVTFIPQSSLFLVPFAALQDEQGKYLIEKHTILTAPAIQVLDLTRQQRQRVSGNQVLVMGNPTMPSVAPKIGEAPQQLPTLPGAETEAKEIAQLLNTKAIIGKDATKAAFMQRLPQARFIHLATHGLLDDFQGLGVPGAVALAPDGKDNGLLTANEILDLKINAELVVLSACDTAQGKLTGDGVVGLSRALISAGAPSVIVTLWSIPDSPSALLMGEFYRQLQKNPDKAQALRQAMLVTMKQHPNPSAWAAFTLIGEAK